MGETPIILVNMRVKYAESLKLSIDEISLILSFESSRYMQAFCIFILRKQSMGDIPVCWRKRDEKCDGE